MQLSYTNCMDVRTELEQLAREQSELPTRRAELVAKARTEGLTWREIGSILNMTPHGLIKAQRAHEG